MAKGSEAKKIIADKIINALSDCYVGEVDKKLYFSAVENGEVVQVAISMTCPKTPIEAPSSTSGAAKANFDWSGTAAAATNTPTEISDEDAAKVDELMKRLGISN